jgi:hypothetical protein
VVLDLPGSPRPAAPPSSRGGGRRWARAEALPIDRPDINSAKTTPLVTANLPV